MSSSELNSWQDYLQKYNECCSTEEMKNNPFCKGNRMSKASELRTAGFPANYYCNLVSENRILRSQVQNLDRKQSSQSSEDMLKLQQANYKISRELEQTIVERDDLIKRLNKLERECGKSQELSKIIDSLNKENNESKLLLNRTREELKSCLANEDKFENIRKALSGENQSLKDELKQKEAAVREYAQKVSVSEKRLVEVENRLNNAKSELESNIEQLKLNSQKLMQLREQDQKSLQESIARLRDAEKKTEEYKGATNTARDLQRRLQDKVDRLEDILKNAKSNTVDKSNLMETECNEYKIRQEKLILDINRLQENIKTLENAKDRAIKDHQLCKELSERKEQELIILKTELTELINGKKEIEQAYQVDLANLRKEVSETAEKLVTKKKITEELQKRNQDLEQEMKNLAAQYKENIISMNGEKSDIIELRNNLKEVQEELSKSKLNKEKLQEDIKQIDKDCKALITDKDRALNQQIKDYNDSIERITSLQEKIQLLEAANRKLSEDLANCNSRLASSAQQIDSNIPQAPPMVFEIPVAPAFDIPVPPPPPTFDIPIPPPPPTFDSGKEEKKTSTSRKTPPPRPVQQGPSLMEQLAAKQAQRAQKSSEQTVEQKLEEEKKKKQAAGVFGGVQLTDEQRKILARRAAIEQEEDESDEWDFYFF
jgi:chromosome segregation ATPase